MSNTSNQPDPDFDAWMEGQEAWAEAALVVKTSADKRARQQAMAFLVTASHHGASAALEARRAAEALTSGGTATDDSVPAQGCTGWRLRQQSMERVVFPVQAFVLLRALGLASSGNQARQLIIGGGVRIDGGKILDPETVFAAPCDLDGRVLSVGKKTFRRLEA